MGWDGNITYEETSQVIINVCMYSPEPEKQTHSFMGGKGEGLRGVGRNKRL